MASHPRVACWRELLFGGEGGIKDDYFTRSPVKDFFTFLDKFFLYEWGPRGIGLLEVPGTIRSLAAVGFKLKYEQVQRYPAVMDYFLYHKSAIKVIHLIRRNLLATLISSLVLPAILARFKGANIPADVALDGLECAVWVNPETLILELEALDGRIARAKESLHDLNSLEVAYEDLLVSQWSTCCRVLEFLEVDSGPALSSRYRKILPVSPLESIKNIEQVKSALKGTRFEAFLVSESCHG
jgi:hypothetical protein